eukprot:m.237655 g.237655  ORF g.237655 m.237655 type:complete len:322 (-) comp13176_c0_seq1:513-1478(-)
MLFVLELGNRKRLVNCVGQPIGYCWAAMCRERCCRQHRRGQLVDVIAANQPHSDVHLVAQDGQHPLDARLPICRQAVQHGPPDADRLGAQRERLQHVCPAPNTSVDVHLHLVLQAGGTQGVHDLCQDLDAGARKVQLTAAVVGADDAGDAVARGLDRVLAALDALQHDRHARDRADPREVRPVERGVDELRDGSGHTLVTLNTALLVVGALHRRPTQRKLVAHILLAPSQLRRVHGHEERAASAHLGLADQLLRHRAVVVDVQLEEQGLPGGLGAEHLRHGARGQRRQHVDHALLVRCPHDGCLALGMREAAEGSGGDVHR